MNTNEHELREEEGQPLEAGVSSDFVAELNRRMENFRENPHAFTTWEAMKERIRAEGKRRTDTNEREF
jgi:putative addiction module component (TIGR02574 family)